MSGGSPISSNQDSESPFYQFRNPIIVSSFLSSSLWISLYLFILYPVQFSLLIGYNWTDLKKHPVLKHWRDGGTPIGLLLEQHPRTLLFNRFSCQGPLNILAGLATNVTPVAKSLGVFIDADLSSDVQIKKVVQACAFQLRNIAKVHV